MRTKKGGETVDRGGFYVSFGRKEFFDLEENRKLPGTKADTFYSVPVVVMLLAGPLIGLLYVMFLPFISLAMVAGVLSRAIWVRARKAEKRLIQVSLHRKVATPEPKVSQDTGQVAPLAHTIQERNEGSEENRKTAA